MSDDIPILEGRPLEAEDVRLLALFDRLEEGQLDFLDQAGKRIVELSSAMLGILFAVAAFGKDFPPPYLKGNLLVQALSLLTLLCFVLALLAGVLAVQPRRYDRYRHNLSRLRDVLGQIVAYKTRWFRFGSGLFFAGALALAVLVSIILVRS